jgi:hypothetical protein
MPGLLDALSKTWPARLAQDAWRGVTLPRDVYQGKVDPLSADAIGRATNLAMLTMLSATGAPAGALGSGPVFPAYPGLSKLSMDEASRMARAKELGYSETPFFRGEATGKLPSEYPSGAHYSRNKDYAAGFARKGGQEEPREFRLDLRNTFNDKADLTAQQYNRLVAAADPKLAGNLVEMIAPGKSVDWFHEFAMRNPEFGVTSGGSAMVRHAIEKNAQDPVKVFTKAGFDALDSGRDVRTLTGFGQRLKEAAFDPAKADLRNIMAGFAAASLGYPLYQMSRSQPQSQ